MSACARDHRRGTCATWWSPRRPRARRRWSAAQTLAARLAPLVDSGVIAGVESASRYLPPAATQRARQASLPEGAVLEERRARGRERAAGEP